MIIYKILLIIFLLSPPLFSHTLYDFLKSKGIEENKLALLRNLKFDEEIARLNLFQREVEGKYSYALSKKSIDKMLDFYRKRKKTFDYAERKYKVPWSVIVPLLYIESHFDRKRTEKFHVLTVFYTLSLLDNGFYLKKVVEKNSQKVYRRALRKSRWAKMELAVLLSGKIKEPEKLYGSWAGAIGLCQFIPSSYVKYGVDGDGDGIVDLYDPDDAVMSVANYLRKNGWGRRKEYKVLFSYNRSAPYCKTILKLRDILERKVEGTHTRTCH